MNSLSIFGTSSDAGKSTLSFAITYLLHHKGISVVPFKAQNVSNNSQVTDEGGEIAIPQYFAAEAIGLKTTPDMNPVLLKSGVNSMAHIIINGKSVGNKDIWSYYRDINSLKPHAKRAFKNLQKKYECIVAVIVCLRYCSGTIFVNTATDACVVPVNAIETLLRMKYVISAEVVNVFPVPGEPVSRTIGASELSICDTTVF